nr:RimK family alpha-L-glutamate ligase [Pseudovibrio flavus]
MRPEAYEINRLIEQAKLEGIELEVFRPDQFDLIVTREDERSILVNSEKRSLPDFVIPRMGAGTTYFTLAILRQMERLGIHIVNSPNSIDLVKDKLYSQQVLAQNNLPVPKTMLVKFPVNADLVENDLGFPVVVKTLSGSQGSGVFLAENRRTFEDLMQLIEATNKNANIILQEFVSQSRGTDLRVFTLGGRAIACFKRTNNQGGFKANFSAGGSVEPYEITPEIEWLATQTSKILNLDMAGIDLLFDNDHFKICEANSSPGFEGLEKANDINVAKEIFHYLRVRLGMFDQQQGKKVTPAAASKAATAKVISKE